MSIEKSHHSFEEVSPAFKNEIQEWTVLENVAIFLVRFNKASANQVLSNADELADLTSAIRTSVIPKILNTPSIKARIMILHNEALRLEDMNKIPAITAEEVHEQINKVIDAYSSLNSKVNTVFRKKRFEDAIDVDVSFIGLDTTKIDSVSKKTIDTILRNNSPKPVIFKNKNRKRQ
ncbi:MAG: hypothetical protein HWD82_10030 [Flavobacteriaceae bacterium]|nr:hypothetical protein [Flavobacteriaceae bacterium]